MAARVLIKPDQVPTRGGAFTRGFGRAGLAALGWRVRGAIPDLPKAMVIAAPHSSNWDAALGLLAAFAMNIDFHWMGKDAAFRFPLGLLTRPLGGIPVDRSNPSGLVGQSIERLQRAERLWLVLAPEGTRRVVPAWRSGFWHIARGAGVPLVPAYFHYPEKCIGVMEPFHVSDDFSADMERLQTLYAPWRGRRGSGKD